MNKKFKLGFMVGRFQMLHKGHESLINEGLELCERFVLLLGNSEESRTKNNPFTMSSGDRLQITTGTGNKHLYYTDVATGTERDISQYLTEDSEFVQLGRGDNTIGYDAESGAGNMTITITYRLRYAGA